MAISSNLKMLVLLNGLIKFHIIIHNAGMPFPFFVFLVYGQTNSYSQYSNIKINGIIHIFIELHYYENSENEWNTLFHEESDT